MTRSPLPTPSRTAASAVDVEVEGVVTGVEHPAHEPAVEGRPRIVEEATPPPVPVNGLGRARPEVLGGPERFRVQIVVRALHRHLALRVRRPSTRAFRPLPFRTAWPGVRDRRAGPVPAA